MSKTDLAELFFSEAKRQGNLAEWDVELSAGVTEKFSFNLRNGDKKFYVSIIIDSIENIDSYVGDRKNLMIHNKYVPIIITNDKELVSFWDNKANGLIFVLQYLAERFGMTIDDLILRKDGSPNYSNNLRRIVCACSQVSIKNVIVGYADYDKDKSKHALSAEDYRLVMEKLTVADFFGAYSKNSKKFKFNGTIKAKSIKIENGHWFKIKHLLEWDDYEELEVEGKNFTAKELRQFLEKWVAGGFPKLKSVTLESKEVYKVTDGFEKRTDIHVRMPRGDPFTRIKGPGESYASIWSYPWTPGFNMKVRYQAFREGSP